MKKLISGIVILICWMICPHQHVLSQEQDTGRMIVIVSNIEKNKGQIAISLADSKESYNGEHFMAVYIEAKMGSIKHEFEGIPYGTYAIKVYHDKNNSEELDTGLFGKPTESYGFSNNVSASFGPARWEDARFKFDKDGQEIYIELK